MVKKSKKGIDKIKNRGYSIAVIRKRLQKDNEMSNEQLKEGFQNDERFISSCKR